MNRFGKNFCVEIYGESHGAAVAVVIDGVPPGIALQPEDFTETLRRRQGGLHAASTPRQEADIPNFISGVFNGFTTGAPLCIQFENKNVRSQDYEQQRNFRPGHADFTAHKKFRGFEDYRGGGHFSGRLTVCLGAAGVVAHKLIQLKHRGVIAEASIAEVGGNNNVEAALQEAIRKNDSVGAIVQVSIKGVPAGLGEPFFNSVESMISHAVFSIPAIKGIEFGSGFKAATMYGSEHNDQFTNAEGNTTTNHAGGISGGITNGNAIEFRVAVKPASSTPQPQETYNRFTETVDKMELKGRHDLCIALRVPPVLEAVCYIVLADLFYGLEL